MAPLSYPSPPFPFPTSKQKGLDEGLERNGKQIVHLYLGGDQTLEQILSAFCLYTRCSKVILRRGAGEPEGGEVLAIAALKTQTSNQMCKWERSWSMITFRINLQRYQIQATEREYSAPLYGRNAQLMCYLDCNIRKITAVFTFYIKKKKVYM